MYNVNYSQSDILPGANIAKDSLKSLFSSLPACRVPKNFGLHRDAQMSLKNKRAYKEIKSKTLKCPKLKIVTQKRDAGM